MGADRIEVVVARQDLDLQPGGLGHRSAVRRRSAAAGGPRGPTAGPARPARPPRRWPSARRVRWPARAAPTAVLVTSRPVSGSVRTYSRPSGRRSGPARRALGSHTSTTARPPGQQVASHRLERVALAVPGRQQQDRVQGQDGQPEARSSGQARDRPDRPRPAPAAPRPPASAAATRFLGPGEHRRIDVDRGHVVAGLGQRHGYPARTGRRSPGSARRCAPPGPDTGRGRPGPPADRRRTAAPAQRRSSDRDAARPSRTA